MHPKSFLYLYWGLWILMFELLVAQHTTGAHKCSFKKFRNHETHFYLFPYGDSILNSGVMRVSFFPQNTEKSIDEIYLVFKDKWFDARYLRYVFICFLWLHIILTTHGNFFNPSLISPFPNFTLIRHSSYKAYKIKLLELKLHLLGHFEPQLYPQGSAQLYSFEILRIQLFFLTSFNTEKSSNN